MSAPTTMTMSKTQEADALKALDKQKQDSVKQGATSAYVQDVKQSMLFQPGFNWNDMLSAAPVSVMLLGSLFIASTIPDALSIKIISPKDGFKYLDNFDKPSLNTCLIQCSDTGARAFATAAKSMDSISLKSSSIKRLVNNIIMLLGDPDSARTMLRPTMSDLARTATACKDEAKKIEETFDMWLGMVCELHRCVVQTSSNTSEKTAANQIQLAAAQTRLVSAKEQEADAKKNLDSLRDAMNTATKQYSKAADEFPTGWDLIGQELVSNLSDTLTGALKQAVPALIENFSATAKFEKGMQIFRGDQGGASGGSVGDGKQDHSAVPAATSAPAPVPSAVPPYANDPAYAIIAPIVGEIGTILSFVTGGNEHGVDWDLLSSRDPKKQSTGLGVMIELLKSAQEGFKPSADPPSTTLTRVFGEVSKVTSELQKVVDGMSNMGSAEPPGADSKEVKEWQTQLNAANAQAVQLGTDAKTITNAHSAPLVNQPAQSANPTDQKGALRKQIIDAATTKLTTTAQVMETTSTNFQKSSDKLVDIQTNLGSIQASLAELTASNISLDKIKAVLVKCIDILVQLKSQINRLNAFFEAVSTLVGHVVDDQVTPFINQLQAMNPEPEKMLFDYSYTDFQRQIIFNFCLSIRAYFELFGDITQMYMQVHITQITPGLELVNSLSVEYNGADKDQAEKILAMRQKQLADYNKQATDAVKQMVGERQTKISDNLATNAQNAASDLGFVPVKQTADVQKAVTASTDESKKAASAGIEKSGAYISRSFTKTDALIDNS